MLHNPKRGKLRGELVASWPAHSSVNQKVTEYTALKRSCLELTWSLSQQRSQSTYTWEASWPALGSVSKVLLPVSCHHGALGVTEQFFIQRYFYSMKRLQRMKLKSTHKHKTSVYPLSLDWQARWQIVSRVRGKNMHPFSPWKGEKYSQTIPLSCY